MLNTILAIFEGLTPMNGENLVAALNILWKGLLAIFIVIALIIIAVKITSLAIAKSAEIKERAQKAKTDEENGKTE
ncbi:MAG: hypothetical protein IJ506_00275 [Clostridia bacterium]|nr:hypothetical protein [Clostridia bacterium]